MRIEDIQQGTEMECVLCNVIYPETKGKECPACKGKGFLFQPARMMDLYTSRREMLNDLYYFTTNRDQFERKDPDEKGKMAFDLRNEAIGMIKKIIIYNFELKETLIDLVHELDEVYKLKKD